MGLHQAGNLDAAVAGYSEILSAVPDHPDALHLLGVVALQRGQFVDAVDLIERALASRGPSALYLGHLGVALQSLGRVALARTTLEQAAVIDPSSVDVQFNLGHSLVRRGRIQAGIAAYRAALQTSPQRIDALSELAWVYATNTEIHNRNRNETLPLARLASELSGNAIPEILDTLAAAQAEAGDFRRAIETATKARELALVASRPRPVLIAEIDKQLVEFRQNRPWRAAGLRPVDTLK